MWAKSKPSLSSNSTCSKLMPTGSGTTEAEEESLLKMVDDEYSEALHTKSYTEMCSRLLDHHSELKRSSSSSITAPTNIEQEEEEEEEKKLQHTHSSLPSYNSSCGDDHIPDFLLEPSQESLLAATSRSSTSTRSLLLDFFDTTLQASAACAALLPSIDRARSHHRNIHQLLANLSTSSSPSTFSQLSSHLQLDNPLSPENLSNFHLIHSRYPTLIRRLASARRKISRRLNLLKFTKRASGVAVIALLGAAVAAVVIVSHGAATVAIAPAVTAAGGMGNWFRGWMRLERAKARVDAAAKGAYIVGRDLDTMNRMVRRVCDEVEHGRDVGRMVVANREWEMAREVVKEMEGRGGEVGLGLEEQLEELEEHVYLCLITINRSRRLVAQEMVVEMHGASAAHA